MKKIVFLILVLSLFLFMASCDGETSVLDDKHETSVNTSAEIETANRAEQSETTQISSDTSNETEITTETETEAHVHAFGEWATVKEASCTENGEQKRTCACGETEMQSINMVEHNEVIDEAVPPTCTATGLTEGSHCSACNTVIIAQETVKKNDHSFGEWKITKDPSCTEKGSKERFCNCGEKETQDIDMEEHTEVIDKAVPATCSTEGLTEGSHCSVCKTVLIKQMPTTTSPHTEEIIPAVDPTKNKDGLSEGVKCSVCGHVIVKQTVVPSLGGPADIWDGSIATSFAGGSGTENDPYLVSTGAQLAFLAKSINSKDNNNYYDKYYKLTNPINLNGREWTPIGNYALKSDSRSFKGHFDGDGYEISNFKITKANTPLYIGLFGRASEGSIKNLGVVDFTITLSSSVNAYVGGLAGTSSSTITSCYAIGDITFTDNKTGHDIDYIGAYAGGLVGRATGVITDCYTAGNVNLTVTVSYGRSQYRGSAYAGGLVGFLEETYSVSNCYSTANVTAHTSGSDAYAYTYAGGLVGYGDRGTISSCYAAGNVNASSQISGYEFTYTYAGGFIAQSNSTIADCYATGDVIASAYGSKSDIAQTAAGGFVGELYGSINNCYSTGDVSVSSTGGSACFARSDAGGFIGRTQEDATVSNSYATGNVSSIAKGSTTSKAYAGGFIGINNRGVMTNNYRYDGQSISAKLNNTNKSGNTTGTACTLAQLNSAAFYTETLGWSNSIWDLSELDFANDKIPGLI